MAVAPLALLTVALMAGRGGAPVKDLDTTLRGNGKGTPSTLQQYRSGGHVLGFESRGYYVSNGTYALRVEFVDAASSAPVADGAASTNGAAAPLGRVTYAGLWPGVRAEYDAPEGAILRSTWHVAPGADPGAIRLRYNRPPSLNADGSLTVMYDQGAITENAPVAWQEVDGERRPVQVAFVKLGDHDYDVGFRLGAYRRDLPLAIDPSLSWYTFLGGPAHDDGGGIALDEDGNVYVVGTIYPSGGNVVRAWGDNVRRDYTAGLDAFVAKLNSDGGLLWNTFLGGEGRDEGKGIAVSSGIYVVGTSSADWGETGRGRDYTPGANVSPRCFICTANFDAFAAKLSANGDLIWHTFLGGDASDVGSDIVEDESALVVYVTGYTESATWGVKPLRPYTAGTGDTPGKNRDAFVAKLEPRFGTLRWHTYLGGDGADGGSGIAVDSDGTMERAGNVYVAGTSTKSWGDNVKRDFTPGTGTGNPPDAFAAKLNSEGTLTWNTFLGSDRDDGGADIAVDSSGNVFVVGRSNKSWGDNVKRDYTEGTGTVFAQDRDHDAFAAKLNSQGDLTWNTFLGGERYDFGAGIAVDSMGRVYVAGTSGASWGTPARGVNATTQQHGISDAFAAALASDGVLTWHAFLGGSDADRGRGIAVRGNGLVYVSGTTVNQRWPEDPLRPHSGLNDTFVAHVTQKIDTCGNGNLDEEEECDDGNQEDGDSCSSTCQFAIDEFCCDLGSATCDETSANDCALQGGQFQPGQTCDFTTGSCLPPRKMHRPHPWLSPGPSRVHAVPRPQRPAHPVRPPRPAIRPAGVPTRTPPALGRPHKPPRPQRPAHPVRPAPHAAHKAPPAAPALLCNNSETGPECFDLKEGARGDCAAPKVCRATVIKVITSGEQGSATCKCQ